MYEMFFLCFRLFYIDCSQEFIAHERCKMDDFRARWWWISVHNWENMYHRKLKLDMERVNKLFSMWSKAYNDLRNFFIISQGANYQFGQNYSICDCFWILFTP